MTLDTQTTSIDLTSNLRARRAKNNVATVVMTGCFLIALVPLVWLLATVISKGWHDIASSTWWSGDQRNSQDYRVAGGGALHAIIGTVEQVAVCSVISIPLGVLAAVYLVEYGHGRLRSAVTFMVDILTGIPSIVAALFIYAIFIIEFGADFAGIYVSLALVLLMIPVIVRTTEEMLKLVPNELREASYALGIPKWKTILKIVLPTAISGILTGIVLGVARVAGETAPALILVQYSATKNWNLFSGNQANLPLFIFNQYPASGNKSSKVNPFTGVKQVTNNYADGRMWSAALTLCSSRFSTSSLGSLRAGARSPTNQIGEPMAKRIDVSDVNIYYSKFLAVSDVNLTIQPRSVTAFIGPSGCGKSTVLRTLNRMHEVIAGARVEGTVKLDGEDIYGAGIDPVNVRRTIGMVFQRPNPFPTMSIYDNVVAGLKLGSKKLSKNDLDGVVETSLRSANLWDEVRNRLNKPGSGLSGGQQQRLCIARAIAVKPQVLLMDEPCSALDPISTLAIEDLIQELKTDYTIVIVTHNMQQAARVSERTAFFNLAGIGKPGQMVEIDDTDKIFSNPRDKRTEDYISGRFG
jgi:phosphate transport system ATP-binding protein